MIYAEDKDDLTVMRFTLGRFCGHLANEMTKEEFERLERLVSTLENLGRRVSHIDSITIDALTRHFIVTHGLAEELALSTGSNGNSRRRTGKNHLDLENDKYASRIDFEIPIDEKTGGITPDTLLSTYNHVAEFFGEYNFHLEKFT